MVEMMAVEKDCSMAWKTVVALDLLKVELMDF